mmetsp:Transcript_4272/g.18234  ORF Transcript_4272/g.18234 Transcript_4272/m.18234 type:complete len:135 (-) Transcript_4272:2309-2713(-)
MNGKVAFLGGNGIIEAFRRRSMENGSSACAQILRMARSPVREAQIAFEGFSPSSRAALGSACICEYFFVFPALPRVVTLPIRVQLLMDVSMSTIPRWSRVLPIAVASSHRLNGCHTFVHLELPDLALDLVCIHL